MMFGNVFAEVEQKNVSGIQNKSICTRDYTPVCTINEKGEKKTASNECNAGTDKIIKNGPCDVETIKLSTNIKYGQYIESPLKISGNSEGLWSSFEGELGTVVLVSNEGDILSKGILEVVDYLKTEDMINFKSEISFEPGELESAKLIFRNNNVSENSEVDKSFELMVNFKANTVCTEDYSPVCGKVDVSEKCLKEPCPSFVEKDFSNKCEAKINNAEILSESLCIAYFKDEIKEEEKEDNLVALKKKKYILDKKSEEIFSKFETFIVTLQNIIIKIEAKIENSDKNTEDMLLKLEAIKSKLFSAENQKNEAKLIFIGIIQKKDKAEIKSNLEMSEELLVKSKANLKNVFKDIKDFINLLNKK